jgi:CDGSH-type Zn-finger protein
MFSEPLTRYVLLSGVWPLADPRHGSYTPGMEFSDNGLKSPCAVEVEAGKTYHWCACGLSRTQPFCDGSHKGSGVTSKAYRAVKSGKVYFCGCKKTEKGVLCDGSHSRV